MWGFKSPLGHTTDSNPRLRAATTHCFAYRHEMDEIRYMTENTQHPSVMRVQSALRAAGYPDDIRWLEESARTAAQAAEALGIDVGQIASSIVFCTPANADPDAGTHTSDANPHRHPVLVITSGRHRVETRLVEEFLGTPLARVDADFVRAWSGFAIGGVAPIGWHNDPDLTDAAVLSECLTVIVDRALAQHETVWAAAGHTHTVFPTSFNDLVSMTGGTPLTIGD